LAWKKKTKLWIVPNFAGAGKRKQIKEKTNHGKRSNSHTCGFQKTGRERKAENLGGRKNDFKIRKRDKVETKKSSEKNDQRMVRG